MMLRLLLCMLEAVEGGLCLLEVLDAMRCVLLRVLDVMRCVLLRVLELWSFRNFDCGSFLVTVHHRP